MSVFGDSIIMSRRFIIRDPLALHREGVVKSRDIVTWKDNISVAEYISETLKPCLGPKGMLKIVTDKFGETAVTNDGAIILEKMDLHHPVAKVLREAAKTIENSVGDGTKTAIILAGELLKRAEGLVANKIKINKILEGYRHAYNIALTRLREMSSPLDVLDKKVIRNLTSTLFSSRGLEHATYLSELTSQLIFTVVKLKNGKIDFVRDAIRIVKKLGESVRDSRIIDGVIIDKKIAHPSMPRIVKNARIAVLNMALKIDEFKHLQPYKYQIEIREPQLVGQFLLEETEITREMVDKIRSVGANVVICRKKIGRIAKQLLAESGIVGISRLLNEEEFTTIAKITGANIVSDLNDLREADLGRAATVREEKIGEDRVVIIEGCGNYNGASLLLRAGTTRILDEIEHAVKDSLRYISSLFEEPFYLPGGGAVEEALSIAIRNESLNYTGKEQVAMHAFANSLETIPRLIVRNAGYDPTDVITELRSKHVNGHYRYGFDAYSGKIVDAFEHGIVESYKMKDQILKTSYEVATLLLRVDESIDRRYAKRHEGELGGQ